MDIQTDPSLEARVAVLEEKLEALMRSVPLAGSYAEPLSDANPPTDANMANRVLSIEDLVYLAANPFEWWPATAT